MVFHFEYVLHTTFSDQSRKGYIHFSVRIEE